MGQDAGYPSFTGAVPDVDPNHAVLSRSVARDGTILLKNENNVLPLQSSTQIAVIGSDAYVNGSLIMGDGSGAAPVNYVIAPIDALSQSGSVVADTASNDPSTGAITANAADVAIVFVSSWSAETIDRTTLDPDNNGNDLVAAVANTGKPTIVVAHSVGPIVLESILSNENVVAIIWGGVPGPQTGNALCDVLYGLTSPSGKLPFTIAQNADHYGTSISNGSESDFTEGLYIDYRHFDQANIEPRYEFGFGLCKLTEFQSWPFDTDDCKHTRHSNTRTSL
jgi:beta-glucosidase